MRQREVLLLIAVGLSTRQIAVRLGVSPKTVEAHKEHIKCKLTLHSAAELSHFARAWKMGTSPPPAAQPFKNTLGPGVAGLG